MILSSDFKPLYERLKKTSEISVITDDYSDTTQTFPVFVTVSCENYRHHYSTHGVITTKLKKVSNESRKCLTS